MKCGVCGAYCPEGVAEIIDGKLSIDYNYCKGCGICAEECPSHAIRMVSEEAKK
jgi:pyruvate ferredoxin oxidoreductase delta subunit